MKNEGIQSKHLEEPSQRKYC